jgi:signal peptidase I
MSEQDRTTEAAGTAQQAAEPAEAVQQPTAEAQAANAETVQQPAAEAQAANAEEQAANGKKKKKEKVKKSLGMEILSWVWTLLIAFAVAMVVRAVIFEPVRVDGHSMDDTLADQEIMLVSKYDYNSVWLSFPWQSNEAKENAPRINLFGNPKQFDVVICRYPGRGDTNFVKRVIGLPGDKVRLENGQLYVNGTAYEEPYVNDEYRTGSLNTMDEYTVPKKGDGFTVHFEDNRYSFLLNGERWSLSNTVMKCKDENGKALTIKDGGRTFVYDGKTYNQDDQEHAEALAKLLTDISDKNFTVDEDYYFVMGDHRNNSNDSRSQGAIDRSMIIGHVRRVVFPFGNWRGVPNGLEVKK